MRKGIFFLFLFISFHSRSQNVYLEGKQFKLNGSDFYPLVLNYSIEATWRIATNQFYIAPYHNYGVSNDFECEDEAGCLGNTPGIRGIQQDFNKIASMGFNTVRIAALYPRFDGLTKLSLRYKRDPQTANSDIPIDPFDEFDPELIRLINYYLQILELANNTVDETTGISSPLKVIFLLTGNRSEYHNAEQSAFGAFFTELAKKVAIDLNGNALLAYDMINEPVYHDLLNKTKEEACDMITTWYDILKFNDPDHLVTIGLGGVYEVLEFDLAVLKTDFVSLHSYPEWMGLGAEDRFDPLIRQRSRERMLNDMYWFNENSPVPWIIGETGFSADEIYAPTQGLVPEGSEADQTDWAQYTLDATCDCGGSGYSWWIYQDPCHNTGNDFKTWQGLLHRGPIEGEKPAVSVFRSFVEPSVSSCGPCPIQYSDTYDANLLYYNPFAYPTNLAKTIYGNIIDQDGNPIKDALIVARDYLGEDGFGNGFERAHHTFSDANGYFAAIFNNSFGVFNGDATGHIIALDITAASAERRSFGAPSHTIFEPLLATGISNQIVLKREKYQYNSSIENVTVSSPQARDFKAYNSLAISNLRIEAGASSNIYARDEVHITSDFDSETLSEVHIYCAETVPDCPVFNPSNYLMEYRTNASGNNLNEGFAEIEITFNNKSDKDRLLVVPNPNQGRFEVKLESLNEIISNLEIYKITGEKIYKYVSNKNSLNLDLSFLPKGVYLIKAYSEENIFNQKIIIN